MRKYLVKCLNKYLISLEKLENRRKEYVATSAAYKNLTGSIFHYEGRIEQIRDTLRYIDYEKGELT